MNNSLAVELTCLGKPRETSERCREAIAIWPDYAEACNNLGKALTVMASAPKRPGSIERPSNCGRTGMCRKGIMARFFGETRQKAREGRLTGSGRARTSAAEMWLRIVQCCADTADTVRCAGQNTALNKS